MESIEIVKNEALSGKACSIYSIRIDGEEDTLFDKFIDAYYDEYEGEIDDIYTRLSVIGKELGMRPQFYKQHEGKPADGICAFYDCPYSKFRLYFIEYGRSLVILGGGGPKPKSIRAWQESPELEASVLQLEKISNIILKATLDHDIKIKENSIEGELKIQIDQ